ncbi:MAG: hypothetical protein ACI9OJ_005460, partial [Myxococcota bacterium]
MAKPKLQTSKKRVNKKDEELKAPDEVTTALHKLSDHLSKHLKLYVIGLAAVLVVALAITWMVNSREAAATAEAESLMSAVGALNGSVATYADSEQFLFGATPGAAPVKADYADEAERWAAVKKSVEAAKEDVTGDGEALMSLVIGRAAMGQGDMKGAQGAFAEYAEDEEDSSLMPLVLENQGRAAEEQKAVADAAGYYAKVAALPNLYYKVRGSMLLGDLYHPKSGAGKDKAKAAQYYDEALKAL